MLVHMKNKDEKYPWAQGVSKNKSDQQNKFYLRYHK